MNCILSHVAPCPGQTSPSSHPVPQAGWRAWAQSCAVPPAQVPSAGSRRRKEQRYRSVISDIFDGSILSLVQCLTCDRVSAWGCRGAFSLQQPRWCSPGLRVGAGSPPAALCPTPVSWWLGLGVLALLGMGRAEAWKVETQADLTPHRCPLRWRRSRICRCPFLARRTWPSSTRLSTRTCQPSPAPVGTAMLPRAGLPSSWSISDGMPPSAR